MRIAAIFLILLFLSEAISFAGDYDKETNAERLFSDALNLSAGWGHVKSISILKDIIGGFSRDKYIYMSLLREYEYIVLNRTSIISDSNRIAGFALEARDYSGQAAALYPGEKRFLYWKAEYSRELGESVEFCSAINEILKIDGMDVYANYNMGVICLEKREFKEARKFFINTVAYRDVSDESQLREVLGSYFDLGYINFMEGDYRTAVNNFEKAEELYPGDNELAAYLGLSYAGLLDFTNSIKYLGKIPAGELTEDEADIFAGELFIKKQNAGFLSKKFTNSYYINAVIDYQDKDYAKSLSNINMFDNQKKIPGVYSQFVLYYDNLALGNIGKSMQNALFIGDAAREVQNYDIALEYYEKLENDTNYIPEVYRYLGSIFDEKNDYLNAIKYYNLYLVNPDAAGEKVSAYMRLFYLYFKIGNEEKSAQNLSLARKFASSGSDLYEINFYSGMINMQKKSYKNAAVDFEMALTFSNNNAKLNFLLGSSYYEMNQIEKSLEILEKGLLIDSKEPDIDNLLAYIYSLKDIKLDKALGLINSALETDDSNYAYLDTLGWIYFRKGEFSKSFEVYNKIMLLIRGETDDEGLDEIYYHLGMIYKELGDIEESKKYIRTGYEINPKNSLILKEIE